MQHLKTHLRFGAEVNPFKHRIEIPWYRCMQVLFMSISVAPLRLILSFVMLLSTWLFSLTVSINNSSSTTPIINWRTSLRIRAIQFGLRCCCWCGALAKVTIIDRRGTNVIKEHGHYMSESSTYAAPIIVAAPHSSFYDTAVIVASSGGALPSGVMGSGFADVPFLGRLFRISQPILVSRESPDSRSQACKSLTLRAVQSQKKVAVWPPTLVFPEGTTTNRKAFINFKPGAFIAGVTVQPVLIRYHNSWDTFTWTWDGPSALICFWLTLCQFWVYSSVELLPMYTPSLEECKDPKLFASNIRKMMASEMNVPMTSFTYEDGKIIQLAANFGSFFSSLSVELIRLLHQVEAFKLEKSELMILQLCRICVNNGKRETASSHVLHEGALDELKEKDLIVEKKRCEDRLALMENNLIGLEDFVVVLDVNSSAQVSSLFELYDWNKTGFIDLRYFLLGYVFVSALAVGHAEDVLRNVLVLFDPSSSSGGLRRDDFVAIAKHFFNVSEKNSSIEYDSIKRHQADFATLDELKSHVRNESKHDNLFCRFLRQLFC